MRFFAFFIPDLRKVVQYCNDRNALKAIRPEGWYFDITNEDDLVYCGAYKPNGYVYKKNFIFLESPTLLTETLAELHAIIQAIEWERNNEQKR